jgi:hypothetical protein
MLYDTYPTCFSSVARTKVYIIFVRKSYFNGEMRPQAVWVSVFSTEPRMELVETQGRFFIWNSPFSSVLFVLSLWFNSAAIEKNIELTLQSRLKTRWLKSTLTDFWRLNHSLIASQHAQGNRKRRKVPNIKRIWTPCVLIKFINDDDLGESGC